MKIPYLNIIDKTHGDADTVPGTVIIHDINGDHPSMIVYTHQVADTLKTRAENHPDERYKDFHNEIQKAIDYRKPWLEPFADELGVKVEPFEDFLNSVQELKQ